MQEKLLILPKIEDKRGNLSFIQEGIQIPFPVVRAYWIYDVPGGQKRGSHAFKSQQEVIVALSGSFDVVLDDGKVERRYHLNRSYTGLYVPNLMWRTMDNFSTNSLCLVLASTPYDENDYIRNYRSFKKYTISHPVKELENNIPQPSDYTGDNSHTAIDACKIIKLPVIRNRAGNITPVHNSENIPFDIKRVFYVYDIPAGKKRGGHAHKHCHQFLVAASGSFDVEVDDGKNKKTFTLNRPMSGLYIPPGVWATEKNYSSGAVCLVLTSHGYDEDDYIRKYADFKKYRLNGG